MKLKLDNKVLNICEIFFFAAILIPFYFQGQLYSPFNFEGQPFGRPTENVLSAYNLLLNKNFGIPCSDLGNIDTRHDFISKGGKCYLVNEPFFMFYHVPAIIYGLIGDSINVFYSLLVLSNAAITSLCLYVFSLILKKMGFRRKTVLIGTALFGFGAGLMIYSRLIFVHTVNLLLFLALLNEYLKKEKSSQNKILLFASLMTLNRLVSFLIIIPILYKTFKKSSRKKVFLKKLFFIFILVNSPRLIWNLALTGNPLIDPHFINMESTSTLFSILPKWVRAPIFDAHNYMTEEGMIMPHAIYSFADLSKNGLFLKYHGIFYALFSSDGIIFNSPFLILSLIGLIKMWNEKKELDVFAYIIVINLLIFSLDYKGGFGPRYARFYFPTLTLIMIFSLKGFESSKKSAILFIILAILSVTNNVSLAVRTDWFYENSMDLFSSDLVIFPYIPVKETLAKHDINFAGPEKLLWTKSSSCLPREFFEGFQLDVCECKEPASIRKKVFIPENTDSMVLSYCSGSAGGDGLNLTVKIGEKEIQTFIKSSQCEKKEISLQDIKLGKEQLVIIEPAIIGICQDESILLTSISFK
ncbi:MAG: hypothetical protein GOU97_03175 [Nanoarchaeota archaeon]|nr:hypothetical protein [Nanoarchaeota archaeon]